MSRAHLFILMTTVWLAACAAVAPKVAMADRDPLRRAVVEDVADGMSKIFEVADTTLVPSRAMTGAFDAALMAALRAKGFPVPASVGRGEAFDCRVDPLDGSMYRVTVRVGTTELSRLWVLDGAKAYSGGAWTRRE
jgi:uncharacterized lipoprotein YajG